MASKEVKQDIQDEVARAVRQLAQEVVKDAVIEALEESQPSCCSGKCKERCGLTQSEHFEAHRKINEFFGDLSDLTRSMRSVLVKIIITVLVGAAILGLGIKIDKFF